MLIIGLTGGIATGKSTVAKLLRDLGAVVIDTDQIAHEVIEPHTPVWREIVEIFGREILNGDGTVNRQKLGQIVFNDPFLLDRLNRITHPRIIERVKQRIDEERQRFNGNFGVVVVDAPLLIEAGLNNLVDEIWVVATDEEEQLRRLMLRNGLGCQEALRRLKAQMPLGEKIKYADRMIDNSGNLEETKQQIERLWEEIKHAQTHCSDCP